MNKKNGFLDILDEELSKNFNYDYEINWDKKNHGIIVSFVLEVENLDNIEVEDTDGVSSTEDLLYEDAVLFYNPSKTQFNDKDYLATIPYDEQGLSREFLEFFSLFLQDTVDDGLSDLMDFLESEEKEFSISWDWDKFNAGDDTLEDTEFFKYPRY
ncbi:DUF3013 family protein [Lactovum miscens]|uniref:DUF3013 family protein n=1 Tax=Lactovum miscens TaxID=190387 RepID=A0A841C501_9LACT|nr:DUF3013 family protein [Lactovum miscens]MBB5887347.1 hypothetical protein [Lactovum miscens]